MAKHNNHNPEGPQDFMTSMRPALNEARNYIDGSPMRAAAIGAVAGGLLMSLFSTKRGRSFVEMAYRYATPMVTKYAREFIADQPSDAGDSVFPAH